MGDSHVGLQARLMSQALRKLAGTLNRTDTICIFTNQLREKIGVMFGNPETTPGGRALKFYASVRLDIRRIETLKDGAEAFGNRVRVKVAKNKVAPPFKQAEFDIIYGSGIPWEGTVLDVGLEKKVVQKAGSYFSFGDERLGQGRQNATSFLSENPDLVQQILARIQADAPEDQIISARLLPSQAAGEAAIEVEAVDEMPRGRGGRRRRELRRRADVETRSSRRSARFVIVSAASPRSTATSRRAGSTSDERKMALETLDAHRISSTTVATQSAGRVARRPGSGRRADSPRARRGRARSRRRGGCARDPRGRERERAEAIVARRGASRENRSLPRSERGSRTTSLERVRCGSPAARR